jgi:hypothetical protein
MSKLRPISGFLVTLVALAMVAAPSFAAQRANPANNTGAPWVPAGSPESTCPPAQSITTLPASINGNTCGQTNGIGGWGAAGACTLPGGAGFYNGEDVVYAFSVGTGNTLTFDLPTFTGDLALAIFSTCGDGTTCEANSADSIGSGVGPETIGPLSFTAGTTHFLYVDSYYAAGTTNSCGTYTLSVTGTLPAELVEFAVD